MPDGGQEDVGAQRRAWGDLGPHPVADLDVVETLRDLPDVSPVALEPATVGPAPRESVPGLAEDRAETAIEGDGVALPLQDLVDADLAGVGPDAEDVGEMVNRQGL